MISISFRRNRRKFWADDQRVIAGQPVIDREEFFLDKEGRKSWLLTSKLPLRDRSGKIVGLIGVGRNITFKKQAEEALIRDELEKRIAERTAELAKERLLLRTLIDSLPDLVFVKDSQGRFTVTNTPAPNSLGASRGKRCWAKATRILWLRSWRRSIGPTSRR